MRKFAIACALVLCTGHAQQLRRMQASDAYALAKLLLTLDPEGAFTPSTLGTRTPVHKSSRATQAVRMMFGNGPASPPKAAPADTGASMFGASPAPAAPAFGAPPAPAAPSYGGGGGGGDLWEKAKGMQGPAVVGMNVDREVVFKGYDGFDQAIAAFEAAGLADVLKGPGPYTLFLPVNSAFEKGAQFTAENLKKHIVTGKKIPWAYLGGDVVKTFKDENGILRSQPFATGPPSGTTETAETLGGTITYGVPSIGKRKMINEAVWIPGLFNPSGREDTAFPHDVEGSNGIIHACDGIIP